MKILALNSGSSSIKCTLFENDEVILKAAAERIGLQNSIISHTIKERTLTKECSLPDHRTAMHLLHEELDKAIDQKIAIDAVGHRIVHGGEWYRSPVLIDQEVIKNLKETARFAPLHCEPNIIGIEVMQELLPHIPQVAVFDTAAHATLPSKAFLYGLPLEYYEKYKIRKYGFHGINHQYVANEAAKKAAKPLEALKIITCHLGNGCSLTAFEKGKSIDNSMGLTPLEGVVMGSRSGDLDPAILLYLIDLLGLTTAQLSELLNKKSGLLGLCGKSDMRDIISAAGQGDHASQTAIEVFVYRIQKYIGAYIAALHGVDIIVFTGGIGENSPYIRDLIISQFDYLGSTVQFMTIPANEEKVIAQQTLHLLHTK